MEHKSFSSPQESCAEEVNSPVSLQQWLSFKLRGYYKNFKTGSTSIGRRVFYILKEKRILTQCIEFTYFPSLTVEMGKKQLLPVLHHTCILYDLFILIPASSSCAVITYHVYRTNLRSQFFTNQIWGDWHTSRDKVSALVTTTFL